MSVTAIIKLTAKPGRRDVLEKALEPAVAATGNHPLCIAIELLTCVEKDDELLLVERWTPVQAHQEYISGVIAEGGLNELVELLATDMETLHYTPSS